MAQSGSDGVAWLRAARSRILSGERSASLEEALTPLLAALDLLEPLPAHVLDAFPKSGWQRASGCQRSDAARTYLLNSRWLVDVQRDLLERIVVDWEEDLDANVKLPEGRPRTLRDEVLRLAFRPRPPSPAESPPEKASLIAFVEDETESGDAQARSSAGVRLLRSGQVIAAGIAAASQVLSRSTQASISSVAGPHHASLTRDATLSAVRLLASEDSDALWALLVAASSLANLAQRNKFWTDVVKDICAIPVRIANLLGSSPPPPHLREEDFFANFARQFESAIFQSGSGSDSSSANVQIALLSQLLTKLVRSGIVGRAVDLAKSAAGSDDRPDFLRTLLSQACARLLPPSDAGDPVWPNSYLHSWHRVIRGMEQLELSTRFAQHVVAYLDSVCFVGLKRGDLVTEQEQLRAGSEGRTFLSSTSMLASKAAARLLQLVLPLSAQDSPRTPLPLARFTEIDDDETDAEEISLEDWKRWNGVILGGTQALSSNPTCFTAAMARCLSVRAGLSDASSQQHDAQLAAAIEAVITQWGSEERIRRSNVAETQYLTTLLLGLLAQCSAQSTTRSEVLQKAAFVHGVGAHMSHQDPAIRRMAMIVAEVLDAAVKQSKGPEALSSRRLDFGQKIWRGKGDGKEASRVLRAMFLSWDTAGPQQGRLPDKQEDLVQLLGLRSAVKTKAQAVAPIAVSIPLPFESQATTRSLPERVPVQATSKTSESRSLIQEISTLSILEGGKARKSKPLIAEVSPSDGAEIDRPLRAYALPTEADEDESSSSESDSDDDDEKEETMPSLSSTNEDNGPELLDVNVLKKRQRGRPVYVGELSPLLRSSERKQSRQGLKSAEELIRRKTGWGMEIEENAVDLALALAGLQNNWSTKHFEERRTGALSALIVAAPQTAGGCIIEQYFSGHYSIAQRMSMLNALVEAARELTERGGQKSNLVAKQTAAKNADALIKAAAGGARQYGEKKYPEVRQANALNVLRAPRGTLIQETGQMDRVNGRPVNVPALRGAAVSPLPRYVEVASAVFIFPLVNRFWALINDASARHSRSSRGSALGGTRRAGVWQGAGVGSVLSPSAIGTLLDGLAVLASLARNALDFPRVVVPELLELSLATPRAMLPLVGSEEDSDGMGRIHEGATTLAVVLIDAAREGDQGRFLRREKAMLLRELDAYAGEVFKLEHEKERGPSSGMGRAGRASATLLLRLQEVQSQ